MNKQIITIIAAVLIILALPSFVPAGEKSCMEKDALCMEFTKLAETGQFARIIEMVDAKGTYSEEAKAIIGEAYLIIAGQETNTTAQEEYFCMKALEYNATSAYLGLYFIHARQDPEKALGFLKRYISTKPKDPVPYVLLGEAEMSKENYEAANEYLREARSVSRGRSANLDWSLFQVNYLIGDFDYARNMLDSVVARGQFVSELKELAADPRYADIGIRPEFRKYELLVKNNATLASLYR